MSNRAKNGDISLDERLLLSVVRASELFKKKSSAIFKNYGLTFAQYNVLRVLNSSPGGVSTVTNVGKIMLVTGANMTGLAKRLERDGFLIRKRHPSDERITLLEISPKGKQTLQNIEQEKEAHTRNFVGDLTEEKKTEILDILKQISTRAANR
jgi:DNA-binding MarR family transcriptional regulator